MTRELFLFEARRLVRHPLVWGMTALVLALQTYLSRDRQPHLGVDPVNATGLSTCLAAAVLVVASLAVSRDGRHGMPESLGALPGRAEHRTTAILLATPLVAGPAAGVAVGGYLLIRLFSGPAGGRFDVWEPLTAVAAAMFAATLGVAVGRWARRLIAGPMVVAVLGYLIFMNNQYGRFAWLLPVVQDHHADWPDRPSAVHLLYVLALATCCAALALLRHRPRLAPAVAALAALSVAVPTGAIAAAEPPIRQQTSGLLTLASVDQRVRERYFGPDAHTCAARNGITYCAYKGYESWIPLWDEAIRPAVRALPGKLRVPHVEQTSSTWFYGRDLDKTMIRPPMTWGHRDQRVILAHDVAFWATAIRPRPGTRGCDARGQARTVVALWIIGQVSPPEPPRLFTIDDRHGRRHALDWGPAEIGYAERLLATPGARERVHANWDTLMKPGTTIDQALPLLGLDRAYDTRPGGTPCV
ncbi:hypothetical protein SAMN05444920_12151 [Nonomuraea solani]|uniref:Uncharacterized protein n=1 Tax=Nonomuraea solani TaxID=1144553 RepID=A0A1H6EW07_9ACTN|nr:hypothetical protein [Nonomuraea solani]SEH01603.1 hypothetical protein SAMN05444920_12151 [Nonomuraea solani]